mgnify:CR=1 FL=1|tara:strand:- start:28655 stop:29629 length:975 start_codon:yes stop_codon:yes gene_type:complete
MLLDTLNIPLLTSFVISFVVTFTIIPWLIPRLVARKIVGRDMNKADQRFLPEIGGISVVVGFFLGIYSYIALNNLNSGAGVSNFLLVSLVTVLGIAFIGIIDDLLDMRQSTKAFLPFLFSLPLALFVSDKVNIPLLGEIDFGIFILFLVPFGITCASNSMNMLEGFNGLGTGMGIIIVISLLIMSLMENNTDGITLLIPLLGSLLAFLYFNFYPAKIFPGDTLTLFMGAAIGCAAMPNLKLEGAFLMLPMIFEFFLKLKGKFKAQTFATSLNGNILVYEGKIESLTHILMINFSLNEKQLVLLLWSVQAILGVFLIGLKLVDII